MLDYAHGIELNALHNRSSRLAPTLKDRCCLICVIQVCILCAFYVISI